MAKKDVKEVDSKLESLQAFEAKHETMKKLYPAEYEVLVEDFKKSL